MKLEGGTTQRLDGSRVAIFPHLVVCVAGEVENYLLGGHKGVAKHITPGLGQTYSALTKEYAQVPVGGGE